MLDPNGHLGETAQLYALGELSELERARADAHAAQCAACARELGDAEAAVLRLIEAGEVPATRPAELDRRVRFVSPGIPARAWMAVAAAFLIGLIPWAFTTFGNRGEQVALDTQRQATDAMLAGHFMHAPFVAVAPGAPAGKVVYAREGGWYYAIIAAGDEPVVFDVVMADGTVVAMPVPASKTTRSVFLREPGRAKEARLLGRGGEIASARLVFPAAGGSSQPR